MKPIIIIAYCTTDKKTGKKKITGVRFPDKSIQKIVDISFIKSVKNKTP